MEMSIVQRRQRYSGSDERAVSSTDSSVRWSSPRRLRRRMVTTLALIALVFPSLGALPWIATRLVTVAESSGTIAHAADDGDTPHEHDASDIPGSPLHPLDHDCFPCQVLAHLSRCALLEPGIGTVAAVPVLPRAAAAVHGAANRGVRRETASRSRSSRKQRLKHSKFGSTARSAVGCRHDARREAAAPAAAAALRAARGELSRRISRWLLLRHFPRRARARRGTASHWFWRCASASSPRARHRLTASSASVSFPPR